MSSEEKPFGHLISNIPNTPLNLAIINQFREMTRNSDSAFQIIVRGRGLKKDLAKKDGYRPSRGGGTAIPYASKLSIYIRPRKLKHKIGYLKWT